MGNLPPKSLGRVSNGFHNLESPWTFSPLPSFLFPGFCGVCLMAKICNKCNSESAVEYILKVWHKNAASQPASQPLWCFFAATHVEFPISLNWTEYFVRGASHSISPEDVYFFLISSFLLLPQKVSMILSGNYKPAPAGQNNSKVLLINHTGRSACKPHKKWARLQTVSAPPKMINNLSQLSIKFLLPGERPCSG